MQTISSLPNLSQMARAVLEYYVKVFPDSARPCTVAEELRLNPNSVRRVVQALTKAAVLEHLKRGLYRAAEEIVEASQAHPKPGSQQPDGQDSESATTVPPDLVQLFKGSYKVAKRFRRLLRDPNLCRWCRDLLQGSRVTAKGRLNRLGLFCERHDLTPSQLASMDTKAITELLNDHVTACLNGTFKSSVSSLDRTKADNAFSPGTVTNDIWAVASWLKDNEVELGTGKGKVKLPKIGNSTPTLEDEMSPSPEQLDMFFRGPSSVQVKVSGALIAFSGGRLEVQGNDLGTDGLRLKDFPELVVDNEKKTVNFTHIPTIVVVRKELSKAGHQYLTMMPEQSCDLVKLHLENRMRDGEKLAPESPLIQSRKTREFLTTDEISEELKRWLERAGIRFRPYILRVYCDTQLLIAEGKLGVLHRWIQFWMGHKGDIEAIYTTNKNRLPPHLLDEMRDMYRRAATMLQTIATPQTQKQIVATEVKRALLAAVGYTQEDLEKMNISTLCDDDLKALARKKLNGENRTVQKIIPQATLQQLLDAGYDIISVTSLPDGKILVKYSCEGSTTASTP